MIMYTLLKSIQSCTILVHTLKLSHNKDYHIIINFLMNRTKILIWRQAFASLQHCFLRSEENVVLHNFETPEGV